MATKEFLRKMRQKYHLGEYSHKKRVKTRTRVIRVKAKRRRVVTMARSRVKKYYSRAKRAYGKSSIAGIGGLIKPALIGIGGAHLATYLPLQIPYKEEAAGAVAAYLVGGKNIKSAAVGAGAVFLAKMISSGSTSGNSGTVLN